MFELMKIKSVNVSTFEANDNNFWFDNQIKKAI